MKNRQDRCLVRRDTTNPSVCRWGAYISDSSIARAFKAHSSTVHDYDIVIGPTADEINCAKCTLTSTFSQYYNYSE